MSYLQLNKDMTITNDLLFGLIIACPINEQSYNCPFDKIRKLPIKERFKHLKSLDDERQNELLMKHINCLAKYETKHHKKK